MIRIGRRKRSAIHNQELLILAALASIRIAQGLTSDQIGTLSAFFEVLGDDLALLTAPPCLGRETREEPSPLS